VLETRRYLVAPGQHREFLAMMAEIRRVRRRAGAVSWRLYEDVAHPEGFLEAWSMESWTDHLRGAGRLSPGDRSVLARAAAFQTADQLPARFIAVDPARAPATADPRPRAISWPMPGRVPYRATTRQGTA
jgi:transmembrane secretion effector